jgi:hypothetical protein
VDLFGVVSFATEVADLDTGGVGGTKPPASVALVYIHSIELGSGNTLFSEDKHVVGAEFVGKEAFWIFEGEVDGSELLVLEVLGDPSGLLDQDETVV